MRGPITVLCEIHLLRLLSSELTFFLVMTQDHTKGAEIEEGVKARLDKLGGIVIKKVRQPGATLRASTVGRAPRLGTQADLVHRLPYAGRGPQRGRVLCVCDASRPALQPPLSVRQDPAR